MDSGVFGTSALISGAEPLLVEREVSARIEAARQEAPEAEIADLGPAELADGRLAEAVGGSLFAARSIVVVRDITTVPPEQGDLLVETARQPGDHLCLVLVHPGGVKGKALLDQVTKVATDCVKVDPVKASELPTYVIGEARRAGVRMDAVAARALIDAVGSDLAALSGAVAQLASDWEGASLDVGKVKDYFAGRAEVTGYAVADAVMDGRTEQALEKLRWALSTGVSPVYLLTALAGSLRSLGRYQALRNAQLNASELAGQVGVPVWKLKTLAAQSRVWSPAGLARAIQATAEADAQVKGAATDADFALEHLVLILDQARRSG